MNREKYLFFFQKNHHLPRTYSVRALAWSIWSVLCRTKKNFKQAQGLIYVILIKKCLSSVLLQLTIYLVSPIFPGAIYNNHQIPRNPLSSSTSSPPYSPPSSTSFMCSTVSFDSSTFTDTHAPNKKGVNGGGDRSESKCLKELEETLVCMYCLQFLFVLFL